MEKVTVKQISFLYLQLLVVSVLFVLGCIHFVLVMGMIKLKVIAARLGVLLNMPPLEQEKGRFVSPTLKQNSRFAYHGHLYVQQEENWN